MAVCRKRNDMTNTYRLPYLLLFMLLHLPVLASAFSLYACPITHTNIDLHKNNEILVRSNGGEVNFLVASKGCNFSFNASYTEKEIRSTENIIQNDGQRWTKMAFEVYSSAVYVYPKMSMFPELYTEEMISKLNETREEPADGHCIMRHAFKLDISWNTDVAIACSTPPNVPRYNYNNYSGHSSYSSRHIIWVPVGGILILCAACCRWCRLKCYPCLGKPRSQPIVMVRRPESWEEPDLYGSPSFTNPAPPPYSDDTTHSPPPYHDTTTQSPPPYPDTMPSPPPYPGNTDPSAAAKSNLTTINSDSAAKNLNPSPATNDIAFLPSSSVASSPVTSSPANNIDEDKPPILSRFKNQFGFKRLKE